MNLDSHNHHDDSPPGIGQAMALLGIFLALQTGLIVLLVVLSMFRDRSVGLPVVGMVVAGAVSLVGTVWLGTIICKVPWRQLVRTGPLPRRFLPAVLVLSLGAIVLASEVENLTRFVLPMSGELAESLAKMLDIAGSPVAAGLLLVVVAPVSEELLCRRWLLGSLLRRLSPAAAIPLAALIFGAMHLNPWQFFYTTGIGVVLGFVYWRTRSVGLCIFSHALNNGISFALAVIGPDFAGVSASYAAPVTFQPWWLDAAAVGIVLLGGAWLWRQSEGFLVPPQAAPGELPPVLPPEAPPII